MFALVAEAVTRLQVRDQVFDDQVLDVAAGFAVHVGGAAAPARRAEHDQRQLRDLALAAQSIERAGAAAALEVLGAAEAGAPENPRELAVLVLLVVVLLRQVDVVARLAAARVRRVEVPTVEVEVLERGRLLRAAAELRRGREREERGGERCSDELELGHVDERGGGPADPNPRPARGVAAAERAAFLPTRAGVTGRRARTPARRGTGRPGRRPRR